MSDNIFYNPKIKCIAGVKPSIPKIKFTKDDTKSCVITFDMWATPSDPMTGITYATVSISNKLGNYTFGDNIVKVEGNLIEFTLPVEALELGSNIGECHVYGADAKRLTMCDFKYSVQDTLVPGEYVSSDDRLPVLNDLIEAVSHLKNPIENGVILSEVERIKNENERKANESLRQQAYQDNENRFNSVNSALDNKLNKDDFNYLNDNIKQGEISKIFLKDKLKGASIYLPYNTSTYGTYQTIIDKLVSANCNAISICPKLNMDSKTSNVITRVEQDSVVLGIFQYAKSKGLKTMFKPHVMVGSLGGHANITPSDERLWIQSLNQNVLYYMNLLNGLVDICCLSNENRLQTHENADLWLAFNNSIKAVNGNLLTTITTTPMEMTETVCWDIVDIISTNLYSSFDTRGGINEIDLKKQMYRSYKENGFDFISYLNDLSNKHNKPVMISEMGILPCYENFKSPADWNYNGSKNEDAQALFYKINISTFLSFSNMVGVFLWSACDDFTFVGRKAENVVKELFGGGLNV